MVINPVPRKRCQTLFRTQLPLEGLSLKAGAIAFNYNMSLGREIQTIEQLSGSKRFRRESKTAAWDRILGTHEDQFMF